MSARVFDAIVFPCDRPTFCATRFVAVLLIDESIVTVDQALATYTGNLS